MVLGLNEILGEVACKVFTGFHVTQTRTSVTISPVTTVQGDKVPSCNKARTPCILSFISIITSIRRITLLQHCMELQFSTMLNLTYLRESSFLITNVPQKRSQDTEIRLSLYTYPLNPFAGVPITSINVVKYLSYTCNQDVLNIQLGNYALIYNLWCCCVEQVLSTINKSSIIPFCSKVTRHLTFQLMQNFPSFEHVVFVTYKHVFILWMPLIVKSVQLIQLYVNRAGAGREFQ